MKKIFNKYCSIKTITVVVILLSFNLVSFGQDIHNCLCAPEKPKVEEKKSCCSKEEESTAKEDTDDCCSANGASSCDDCQTCSFEKKVEKEQGTLNENKITKAEAKVIVKESQNLFYNTTIKSYRSDNSPGIRTKVFLEVSNLRI
ncbi:MAG: hypothetical protein WC139_02970 [Candidatus Kapaibacterium sp.]